MRLRFLFVASAVLTVPAFAQQLGRFSCSGTTCTFNLSFDDGYAQLTDVSGAAYSGRMQVDDSRTLPNGTHMSAQSDGPMIYRDSKGRVRTERHASPFVPGRPALPDDFIIAEIHDPVAGFEYVLDPVNRVAHRRAFKPEAVRQFDSTTFATILAHPSSGPNETVEFPGTRTISGVTAYGQKRTSNWTRPDGAAVSQTQEEWTDPASGEILLVVSSRNPDDILTTTMTNYSNAEPAATLFQVPDGYQTVDEAELFQVSHPHTGRGGSSANGPPLMASCEDGACKFTFNPGRGAVAGAVTGAPYSGHRRSADGPGEYRDSFGRVRADPAQVGGGSSRMPRLVRIDDPVAGYIYILDPEAHTAYREKAEYRAVPFQSFTQPAGTRTAPNGSTTTVEDLGTQTISGVTATGQRETTTSPPGTLNQNDKPIVMVNERWIDPKTGVQILAKNTTFRGDMITISMPDYKEGDPDPALFQVPAGYKIVDETGPFTFTATGP
ncbi:MAG TPA: hypothetical protein VHC90_02350 [Bryobacteraceae bacterium]|nr:hypothetical protein [Bryobacteraceae bacterium]